MRASSTTEGALVRDAHLRLRWCAMIATVVGTSAMLTGIIRGIPQFRRIVVRRDTAGVSATTWMLSTCSFISWLSVGIIERIPYVVAFNLISLMSAMAILVLLCAHGAIRRWVPIAVVASAATALACVHILFGGAGVSSLAACITIVMFLPQAMKVATGANSGVSPTTWTLALITSALWLSYGVLTQRWAFIVPNLVTIPLTAYIVWRLLSPVESRQLVPVLEQP